MARLLGLVLEVIDTRRPAAQLHEVVGRPSVLRYVVLPAWASSRASGLRTRDLTDLERPADE